MNRERSDKNSFRFTALVNMSASCSESAELPPQTLISLVAPCDIASLTRWKRILIARVALDDVAPQWVPVARSAQDAGEDAGVVDPALRLLLVLISRIVTCGLQVLVLRALHVLVLGDIVGIVAIGMQEPAEAAILCIGLQVIKISGILGIKTGQCQLAAVMVVIVTSRHEVQVGCQGQCEC